MNTPTSPVSGRAIWLLLLLPLLVGAALRVHAIDDVFTWLDETEVFNERVYGPEREPFLEYTSETGRKTTYGMGWPAVVWLTHRAFGGSIATARMPSAVLGTLAILAVFFLVYRLLRLASARAPFFPAFVAATLTAISIPQIDFSQRIYPYAAVTLLSAGLIALHLEIVAAIREETLRLDRIALLSAVYAPLSAISLFIHASMGLLLGSSLLLLGVMILRRMLRSAPGERKILLALGTLVACSVLLSLVLSAKNPKYGFRPYLLPYYHELDPGAVKFLVLRAYDVLTYNLNLFYDGSLYWPREVNPILVPLVGLCVLGWVGAAAGRFGTAGVHLALLGALCFFITGALSLLKFFPFGGVRQTLFLAPFIFASAVLGIRLLEVTRASRLASRIFLLAYLVAWAIYLPGFYSDRIVPFDPAKLVEAWQENGRLRIYADGGTRDVIRYLLRDHPEIEVDPFTFQQDDAYLYVCTHWGIHNSLWDPDLEIKLREAGYRADKLLEHEARYPTSWDYVQSIYFPPNGLWVYRITRNHDRASP